MESNRTAINSESSSGVSIPLPGIIKWKETIHSRHSYIRNDVSIPLPGIIKWKAFHRVPGKLSGTGFNPVAGNH